MSRILEVLKVSTRLGLTSFGGPIAHLGYFHEEYVKRRQWLDEKSYADLVALCQFLPGPASSQVGIAIGIQRAGRINASVVGILIAALYNPVWTSAVKTPYDFCLVIIDFVLLMIWKLPPWIVVVISAIGGIAISTIA